MAIALVLDEVPAEPLAPRNIILDDRVQTFQDPTAELVYWRWDDDPDMDWQFLGEKKFGSTLSVTFPFDVTTRPIRVGKVAKTDKGVENVKDLRHMVQAVYPLGPTLTSAIYDTGGDIDLVFFKNGTGTGDIQVYYREVNTSVWLLHATDFAHGDTSGTINIPQDTDSVTYQIRLKQVDVEGFSDIKEVTVTGTGADSPPSNLTLDVTEVDICEHEVEINFDPGTGSGDYTIEIKQGSFTWIVLATGVTFGSLPYIDTRFGSPGGNIVWKYRVKQEDVPGYSEEASILIIRCNSEP